MNLLLKSNLLNKSFNMLGDYYSDCTFTNGLETEWGINESKYFNLHSDEKLIIPICHTTMINKYNFMTNSCELSSAGFDQINILKDYFEENEILNHNSTKKMLFYVSPEEKCILTIKELLQGKEDLINVIIHPLCFVNHKKIYSNQVLNTYKLRKKYPEFDLSYVSKYCSQYKIKYGKWWENKTSIKDKLMFFKNMLITDTLDYDYIFVISDSVFLRKLFRWSYFSECEYRIFNMDFERFKLQDIFNVEKIKKMDNDEYKLSVKVCNKRFKIIKKIDDLRINVHDVIKRHLSFNYRKIFPVKFPPKGYSEYYWRNLYLWFEYLGNSFIPQEDKNYLYLKIMIKNIMFYFIVLFF